MPKGKLRADRGYRYRMVLELEASDNRDLEQLVKRYQKTFGPGIKANKAQVLRQLIRDAATKPPSARG